jgi:hypothetical protein
MPKNPDQVVIELRGARAQEGITLSSLESFIEEFIRGLRAFDRVERGAPALKAGQPGARGEAATAFKLISMESGSAILTLEPHQVDEDELFPGEGTLAISNLEALFSAIRSPEPFDPDVADAFDRARAALGPDGSIVVSHQRGRQRVGRIVIDKQQTERLRKRAREKGAAEVQVVGRLHMIDLEPPHKVGIRATDGVDWLCRYEPALEPRVKALLDSTVWARGQGKLTGAQRGSLAIEEIHSAGESEQSSLFTFERVPLDDLMAAQGIRGPQGERIQMLPDELSDTEVDEYLRAILGE